MQAYGADARLDEIVSGATVQPHGRECGFARTHALRKQCADHAGQYIACTTRGESAVAGWIDGRRDARGRDNRARALEHDHRARPIDKRLGGGQPIVLHGVRIGMQQARGFQRMRCQYQRDTASGQLCEAREQGPEPPAPIALPIPPLPVDEPIPFALTALADVALDEAAA